VLASEGAPDPDAFLLLEGWLLEYVRLPGGERVILDFRVPGSLVGLTGLVLHVSDRTIEALTDVVVTRWPATRIRAEMDRDATARQGILEAIARQEAAAARRLVNVTRRSAIVRTAAFLCEMELELRKRGLVHGDVFDWPLSQTLMADALGLTSIHLNRVLRELREGGLVTIAGGRIRFGDRRVLRRLASFEPRLVDPGGRVAR
jgi:CRP-like cAMP-binding protein